MAYTVMSNMSESHEQTGLEDVSDKDISRLRKLAREWMDIAESDVMVQRKNDWRNLHDLKPSKPMILFETFTVAGFFDDGDLVCENELLRNVEKTFASNLKQYHELGDDIVLEPYFRVAWKVSRSDYGVKIEERHVKDSLAYLSNFPVSTPGDISKLKERSFAVDREITLKFKNRLENIFGDIMPVRIGNFDNFFPEIGYTPFLGNNFIGITMDLFKLIGNENMLLWPYDHPDDLHRLLRFLCDDRIRFYNWMMEENLLTFNTDNQFAGPSSYGYVSDLPDPESDETVKLDKLWAWPESQETTPVSPKMFDEFFLPYIAEVSNMFGMSYYGCCEPVDDRLEYIRKAIPNLRTVSISAWNNFEKIGEQLGRDYVHCKKPNPTFISGETPDWDSAKKDISDSFNACKNGNIEFVVRDVYTINGDNKRLREWVEMTKKAVGL